MLASSGPWGSCSNVNIHCSSSSKHLCTLHAGVASWRAPSIFPFRAVRKIHPMVPAAVYATLFSKWELTTYNTFSMLFGGLSIAFQSSTGVQPERTVATWCHHAVWWPLIFSIQWSLRLFYLLGTLPTMPIILLTLFVTSVVSLYLAVCTGRWTKRRQGLSWGAGRRWEEP